jgi:hypothetical protein
MRKALVPMLVSLALCGAATTAMVISTARAQPGPRAPMMVAANTPAGQQFAQNDAPPDGPPPRDLRRRDTGDIADRMKQMCQDRYARETGELTYLQTRLQLTAAQQSAFQGWQQAKLGIARRHAESCAQRPMPTRDRSQARTMPAPADMMSRQEDRLKQRVADIEAERPALAALYNALSPQQRIELIRAGRDDRMGAGQMGRHHMFADARGPRGPMGSPMGSMGGPMNRAPYGPDAPPPPAER